MAARAVMRRSFAIPRRLASSAISSSCLSSNQTVYPHDRPGWVEAVYPRNGRSSLDESGLKHAEIPTTAPRAGHRSKHLHVCETEPQLEAWLARPGHLCCDTANAHYVTNAHPILVETQGGKVFT